MNILDAQIVLLAERLAGNRSVSLWRVGHLAAGRGSFFVDLKSGRRNCTTETFLRVIQYLSDHWPADLDWPSDIPRPEPTPGSPAAQDAA